MNVFIKRFLLPRVTISEVFLGSVLSVLFVVIMIWRSFFEIDGDMWGPLIFVLIIPAFIGLFLSSRILFFKKTGRWSLHYIFVFGFAIALELWSFAMVNFGTIVGTNYMNYSPILSGISITPLLFSSITLVRFGAVFLSGSVKLLSEYDYDSLVTKRVVAPILILFLITTTSLFVFFIDISNTTRAFALSFFIGTLLFDFSEETGRIFGKK